MEERTGFGTTFEATGGPGVSDATQARRLTDHRLAETLRTVLKEIRARNDAILDGQRGAFTPEIAEEIHSLGHELATVEMARSGGAP